MLFVEFFFIFQSAIIVFVSVDSFEFSIIQKKILKNLIETIIFVHLKTSKL